MNDKLFIIITCAIILFIGLLIIYLMMSYFINKNAAEDKRAELRLQEFVKGRIDELLPTIEQLVGGHGVEVLEVTAASRREAENVGKYQTDEDAARQSTLAVDNDMGEEERQLDIFSSSGILN